MEDQYTVSTTSELRDQSAKCVGVVVACACVPLIITDHSRFSARHRVQFVALPGCWSFSVAVFDGVGSFVRCSMLGPGYTQMLPADVEPFVVAQLLECSALHLVFSVQGMW